jgi:hypothetical protein
VANPKAETPTDRPRDKETGGRIHSRADTLSTCPYFPKLDTITLLNLRPKKPGGPTGSWTSPSGESCSCLRRAVTWMAGMINRCSSLKSQLGHSTLSAHVILSIQQLKLSPSSLRPRCCCRPLVHLF